MKTHQFFLFFIWLHQYKFIQWVSSFVGAWLITLKEIPEKNIEKIKLNPKSYGGLGFSF